ncbi:MAG: hypothetical protein ACFFFB_01260 [Candidatus Heimdallarchaeota archaeon]
MAVKDIKSKLEELERKKHQLKPKIDKIEEERQAALAEVNKKYGHMIDDVKQEVIQLESQIMNHVLDVFEKLVMNEFNAKRSTSDYVVTDHFKEFRDEILEVEIFPKELIEKIDMVIDGEPIENIAYNLDKIKDQFKIN